MSNAALPSPILLTGATGFIGSRLASRLQNLGCEVHGVTRTARADVYGLHRLWELDLGNADAVEKLVATLRPRLIFHLASHVAGARSIDLVLSTFQANLASTVILLAAASRCAVERVVLTGSLEEPESSVAAVPSSPYAAAKWAASGYARMFHALYATPVVLTRLFMVYGPAQHDPSKLVPYVTRSLLAGESPRLSNGHRPVDWIYVDDVADGLIAAARAPGIEGQTVDIGSGELVTIRAVVERLSSLINREVPLGFGILPDRPLEQVRAADLTATAAQLGWRPEVTLDSGLERTVAWYRAQR